MSAKLDNPLRILTNHPGQYASGTWRSSTRYYPRSGHGYWSALALGMRLYRERRDYDCVVLGAWRSDFCFAMLQTLLPGMKAPCIMIDCLWCKDKSFIKNHLKRIVVKLADKSVDRYVVWARREIDAFSVEYGINKEKFAFVPYHTTIEGDVEAAEGDYVFSGGNSDRDYKTLIDASRGLPAKVEIASTRSELFHNVSIPENVSIRAYTHDDYFKKLANCRINVVSLEAGLLRSAGQQTFLNSMYLGKPTIVNDPEGARDYIDHGEDGLLVPPNDPKALRDALLALLNDPGKARKMGERAREKARKYSTEEHFRHIVSLAQEVAGSHRTDGGQR